MNWKAEYVVLIFITTLTSYISAILISKTENLTKRKVLLVLALIINLGLLATFKYFNFFSKSVVDFLSIFSINVSPTILNVLLPVGISFYTFQTISYVIDVYKREILPEKHLGIFALYVSFFPQLVAGPIERAKNLLPQFFKKHNFDYERTISGLKLMMWGFFKKLVIADRLAMVVNMIYGNVYDYTGIPLILATVFFAFQIYTDFSGYSDIAIGTARIIGFDLMENFKRPYFSKSFSEFWRRWHISLSSWFRDYLYIPLGGIRVAAPRIYFNLFIVFLVCGMWHGANWTFLVWGGIHGFYLVFSRVTKKIRKKIVEKTGIVRFPKILSLTKIAVIFTLTNLAWIFFRANNLQDAFYVLTHLFSWEFKFSGINLGVGWTGLIIAIISILFLILIDFFQERSKVTEFLSDIPLWLRWVLYFIIILGLVLFGVFKSTVFIYFQF